LLINEVNANIGTSCDLIEIRVKEGGSVQGFRIMERTTTVMNFPTMNVQKNDYIIIHVNGGNATCNPGTATSETMSKNERPQASNARNFDTAYDWYTTHSGLVSTDNVITLLDGTGKIVDAVFLSSRTETGTESTANATTTQANTVAAAGEWTVVSGMPPASFTGADFHPHAALGLASTGTAFTGTSIQRNSNNDTNTKTDWAAPAANTWGANNPGQTDF
jgi:hypothetical protein